MVTSKIQVNHEGLEFRAHFIDEDGDDIDVSSATTKTMRFTDPAGTSTDKTATFTSDGTDGKISYVSTSGFLATEGAWTVQPFVSWANNSFYGPQYNFTVYENLDAP